jgi:hypothetical protein
VPQSKQIRNTGGVRGSRNSTPYFHLDGGLVSSPLSFGASDEYYGFYFDYFQTADLQDQRLDSNAGNTRGMLGRSGNRHLAYSDYNNRFDSFVRDIQRTHINNGDNEFNWSLYTKSANTPYSYMARSLEDRVGSATFAGRIANFEAPGVPTRDRFTIPRWGITVPYERPTSDGVAKQMVEDAQAAIRNNGAFTPLIKAAPNGFVVSLANDFDWQWNEQITDGSFNGNRLLSTYWPERAGNNHPLRDLYDLYYDPDSGRSWEKIEDFNGKDLTPDPTSIYKEFLIDPTKLDQQKINYSWPTTTAPKVLMLGPVSNSNFTLGDGDKIIAASPVMTAAVHRTYRLSDESGDNNDEFKADTVLYPSAVGRFGSNALRLGAGDHIVYYDSSFHSISSKKGNSIFLPSFGAFNWSIDWIPGFEGNNTLNQSWLPPNLLQDKQGPALISPIPWDTDAINPLEGINDRKRYNYAEKMSKFAATHDRGTTNSQSNYLYSIHSKRGGHNKGETLLKTYLNLKQDVGSNDAINSRNPVNKLGGMTIQAGRLTDSNKKGKVNYLERTGDNVFYGMDWQFWGQQLPANGSTLANQLAGVGGFTRAAQHEWRAVTMIGGRGRNTFNLGDVIDHITSNGLFYNSDKSYHVSLTHDGIYTQEEARKQGMAYGNIYATSNDGDQTPIQSFVNLNLQADPTMYQVEIQAADPGKKDSTTLAQNVGAWNGLANATNKLLSSPFKIQEDIAKARGEKAFLAKDKSFNRKIARFVGSVVPFIDTAAATISAVVGLVNLFAAKSEKPPKQQLQSVYLAAGLDPAKKAVVINDWHPYTKININVPSLSASDWNSLTLGIKEPTSTGTRSTDIGAYLQLNKTTVNVSENGQTTEQKTDIPLVVLEYLDKNDSLATGNGYYTWSFIDPDNNGELRENAFNPIRSSSLRLFGQLANPKKLEGEDGKPLDSITFPKDYIYSSEEGFDMRYDTLNYAAFFDQSSSPAGANHYSRYYFDSKTISKEGLPSGWDKQVNLFPFTSDVSLEFDSRSNGWYWQPVVQVEKTSEGEANLNTVIDAEKRTLDLDKSKLWIKELNDWKSFSFNELHENVKAFRYSKLATTFYTSSFDENNNSVPDGLEEVERRQQFDANLKLLEGYVSNLSEISQDMLDEEHTLYSLAQITDIESLKEKTFIYNNRPQEDGLVISFNTVDGNGNDAVRKILLFRSNNQLQPALAIQDNNNTISINPSTFKFDHAQNGISRSFAGLYKPTDNTTQLFEYVPYATQDPAPTNLTFEFARELARSRQLPQDLITGKGTISSHLATINSRSENDAITGLFQGDAWLAGDNDGSQQKHRYPFTKFWQWLEGNETRSQFWSTQDSSVGFVNRAEKLADGPVNNSFTNWRPNNIGGPPSWTRSYEVLAVNGETGYWRESDSIANPSDVTGYLVEYSPISGLLTLS